MNDGRKRKVRLATLLVSLVIIAIAVLAVYFPMKNKAKAPIISKTEEQKVEEGAANTESNNAQFDTKDPSASNSNSQGATAGTAEYYYDEGLKSISNKNYQEAITNFSKAIQLDSKKDIYYSKKAEAQVLAKDKSGAIATVQDGLKAIPGDQLLQNKLDIINTTVE